VKKDIGPKTKKISFFSKKVNKHNILPSQGGKSPFLPSLADDHANPS